MDTTEDDRLWLRRFGATADARARLICLPHAGGAASFFVPMARALAPGIEVLAVQPPGRQDRRREPFLETIPALADAVTERLLRRTDLPTALFGHSMGAMVAFEVARRLVEQGNRPLTLFVSGRVAPSTYREERTHLLGDRELVEHFRSLSGTDGRVLADAEMVAAILPVARADYRAIADYRYVPGPPLPVPMHAFVGDSDAHVSADQAREWSEHTAAGFTLRVFPGGHFYLEQQAAAVTGAIADTVSAELRARERCPNATSPTEAE
ncbi:thioesterase II family protein [Nocardia asteroides]